MTAIQTETLPVAPPVSTMIEAEPSIDPRLVVIARLPASFMIVARCQDCCAENEFGVGALQRQRVARETPEALTRLWRCWRESCQGTLDIEVEARD